MPSQLFGVKVRKPPISFAYSHVLMLLYTIAIIFFSLLLAGCTSSSGVLPNIFVTSLRYQRQNVEKSSLIVNPNVSNKLGRLVQDAQLEIRTNFLGYCMRQGQPNWTCSRDASDLTRALSPHEDPLNLIRTSAQFQKTIIFYGLIIACIILCVFTVFLLWSFPSWREDKDSDGEPVDIKPFPSPIVLNLSIAFGAGASVLALCSALWQHSSAVAMASSVEDMAFGTVVSEVGATAAGLGWAAFGTIAISTLGIVVTKRSIKLLDRLALDEL